jgi:hypothetical protein
MRIPNRICATTIILTSFAVTSPASTSKAQTLTQRANTLFAQGGYPLLFVGRIAGASSESLPCTVQNQRPVVFHIGSVLSGFAPPTMLKVLYPSCGGLEPEFSARGDLLVLVVCNVNEVCSGLKQLTLSATPQNVNWAQSVIKADLRAKIARFLRSHGPPHDNSILIFEGIVVGPIPQAHGIIFCKELVNVPFHFEITRMLRGTWGDKRLDVGFGACGSIPGWPLRAGQSMIVFATVYKSPIEVSGDFNLLFPSTQFNEVRAALMLYYEQH